MDSRSNNFLPVIVNVSTGEHFDVAKCEATNGLITIFFLTYKTQRHREGTDKLSFHVDLRCMGAIYVYDCTFQGYSRVHTFRFQAVPAYDSCDLQP